MAEYCNDPELSEYVCIVEWLAKVPRQEAKWLPKSKLYTTTHVRAALDAQPHTIKFIEQAFNVNVRERIV